MPGPLLSLVIAESMKRGKRAGIIICAGHALLEAVTIAFIISGLAARARDPGIYRLIELIGSGLLIFLGITMITSRARPPEKNSRENASAGSDLLLLAKGVTVSAGNPYWLLWWLTVGFGFMMSFQWGFWAVLVFFLGHTLADCCWYYLVSAGITRGRKFMAPRIYRTILRSCGLFLVVFAGFILLKALRPPLH